MNVSEDDARAILRAARWPQTNGEPVCPRCGSEAAYKYKCADRYRCKACLRQFTVTARTRLQSSKLPTKSLLLAVALFVSGAKGTASLQISRMLGTHYKTAFVFAHKLREAIYLAQQDLPALTGEVEIDGAFFGGHRERFNYVNRRTGKLETRHRYGERRVVVVVKQRGGRTLTQVVDRESDAFFFIHQRVSTSATIHADLGKGWDALQELYRMLRVNHKIGYKQHGACTNNAESFYALLRRKQLGVHHRMSGKYLNLYAAEMAWRNDHKARTPSDQIWMLLELLTQPNTRSGMSGYWSGDSEYRETLVPRRGAVAKATTPDARPPQSKLIGAVE